MGKLVCPWSAGQQPNHGQAELAHATRLVIDYKEEWEPDGRRLSALGPEPFPLVANG